MSARAVRNIDTLLDPASVVVVGASDRGDKPGTRLAHMLGRSFTGALYGVNQRHIEVPGLVWAPSVEALPVTPELACIALPAQAATDAFDELSLRGLKAAVVFSSGFSESGESGARLEAKLAELARARGVALCGPNTAGVISTRTGFVGSFSHALEHGLPAAGSVMVITQSGAVGGILLTHFQERHVGVSSWISVGNGTVLDVPDYLHLAARDDRTRVVALFLEGLHDGAAFLDAAGRCVAAGKQVVVLKGGRSEVGARAARSHTGKLTGADAAYDGAFRQTGLVRVGSLRELVDVCQLLTCADGQPGQPARSGRRGAVASVSGAGCTLIADELDRAGLELAAFSPQTAAELDRVLPGFSQKDNPVDLTGAALEDLSRLDAVVRAITSDPGIDFLVLSFATNNRADIAATVAAAWCRRAALAVVLPVAQSACQAMHDSLVAAGVPTFRDMTDAARALAAVAPGRSPGSAQPGRDRAEPAGQASQGGAVDGWLSGSESIDLARAAGLPMVRSVRVATAGEAAERASHWGVPVAVKVDHPDILHKADVGGVRLGVDPGGVAAACDAIVSSVGTHGVAFAPAGGFVLQEMVDGGVEVLIGFTPDDTFGHVVTIGCGGTWVEVLRETASRVVPLSATDVRDAVAQTRLADFLTGSRTGMLDAEALIDLVVAFQAFCLSRGEIIEAEFNPVVVRPAGQGCLVVDARIRTVPRPERPDSPERTTVSVV